MGSRVATVGIEQCGIGAVRDEELYRIKVAAHACRGECSGTGRADVIDVGAAADKEPVN